MERWKKKEEEEGASENTSHTLMLVGNDVYFIQSPVFKCALIKFFPF